jgi:hypothetical protein
MYRFQQIRHFVNEEIDYGFSVAIDLTVPGQLNFDCFLIVDTELLRDGIRKPRYLRMERFDDLIDYFKRTDEGIENYATWSTDDVQESKPVLSGAVDWLDYSEQMESGDKVPYFYTKEQAMEYGKLFGRLYELADEFLGCEEADEDEDDSDED